MREAVGSIVASCCIGVSAGSPFRMKLPAAISKAGSYKGKIIGETKI